MFVFRKKKKVSYFFDSIRLSALCDGAVIPRSIASDPRALQGALRSLKRCSVSSLVRGSNGIFEFLECDGFSGGGCGTLVAHRPLASLPPLLGSQLIAALAPSTAPLFLQTFASTFVPTNMWNQCVAQNGCKSVQLFLVWLRSRLPSCMQLVVSGTSATITMACNKAVEPTPPSGPENAAPVKVVTAWISLLGSPFVMPGETTAVYLSSLAGSVTFSLADFAVEKSFNHNWNLVANFNGMSTLNEPLVGQYDFQSGKLYAHTRLASGTYRMLDSTGRILTGPMEMPSIVNFVNNSVAMFPSNAPQVDGCDFLSLSRQLLEAVKLWNKTTDYIEFCTRVHGSLPSTVFSGIFPDSLTVAQRSNNCMGRLTLDGLPWDTLLRLRDENFPVFYEALVSGSFRSVGSLSLDSAQSLESFPVVMLINMIPEPSSLASVSLKLTSSGISMLHLSAVSRDGVTVNSSVDFSLNTQSSLFVQRHGYAVFKESAVHVYTSMKTMINGACYPFNSTERQLCSLHGGLEEYMPRTDLEFGLLELPSDATEIYSQGVNISHPVNMTLQVNQLPLCVIAFPSQSSIQLFANQLNAALQNCGIDNLLRVTLANGTNPSAVLDGVLSMQILTSGSVYVLEASDVFRNGGVSQVGPSVSLSLVDLSLRINMAFGRKSSYIGPNVWVNSSEFVPSELLPVYPKSIEASVFCFDVSTSGSTSGIALPLDVPGALPVSLGGGSGNLRTSINISACFIIAPEFVSDAEIEASTSFVSNNETNDSFLKGTVTFCLDVVVRGPQQSSAVEQQICESIVFHGNESALDTFMSWIPVDPMLRRVLSFSPNGNETSILVRRENTTNDAWLVPVSLGCRSTVKGVEDFLTPFPAGATFAFLNNLQATLRAEYSALNISANLVLFHAVSQSVNGYGSLSLGVRSTQRELLSGVLGSFHDNSGNNSFLHVFEQDRSAILVATNLSISDSTSDYRMFKNLSLVFENDQTFAPNFGDEILQLISRSNLTAGGILAFGTSAVAEIASDSHLSSSVPLTTTSVGANVEHFSESIRSGFGFEEMLSRLCSKLSATSSGTCVPLSLGRANFSACFSVSWAGEDSTPLTLDLPRLLLPSLPPLSERNRQSAVVSLDVQSQFCVVFDATGLHMGGLLTNISFAVNVPEKVDGRIGATIVQVSGMKLSLGGSLTQQNNDPVVLAGGAMSFDGLITSASSQCSLKLRGDLASVLAIPATYSDVSRGCQTVLVNALDSRPIVKALKEPGQFASDLKQQVARAISDRISAALSKRANMPLVATLVFQELSQQLVLDLVRRSQVLETLLAKHGDIVLNLTQIELSPQGVEQYALTLVTSALCDFMPFVKVWPGEILACFLFSHFLFLRNAPQCLT